VQNDNLGFLDALSILSVVLQLQVYEETKRQTTNDDLMKELQKQDQKYFETIIENQNLILEKLAELG
jgi:hypothetical protein